MQWNGASRCEFDGKSMETETTTWLEFSNGGKAIVEQIVASEERNKSKRAGLWESQPGIRMPKQNVVSVFHVIHLSHNNSINPMITDMNQPVLADIRLSLGLPEMIAKI